jgi:hypothetical protein
VPGAIIAVALLISVSALTDASTHGVAVVGAVDSGFPPIGLPRGIDLHDWVTCTAIAFSCFILIIAQSAATSRSFAMKHGQGVDVNRDIVGLSGANIAAGLSGTFVVNGSPTKTQILDEQKGRTQLANLTLSAIVLLVAPFFTTVLTNMPKAVLGAIVFLIGIDLIDITGLRRIARRRRSEFVIALVTGVVVCAVGVEQGVILAIVLSLVEVIRRQYRPKDFVLGVSDGGPPTYQQATPGAQSAPGLIVFRYDAEILYANANRFVDEIQSLVDKAPDKVRWLILDAAGSTTSTTPQASRWPGRWTTWNPVRSLLPSPALIHRSSRRSARTTSSTGSGAPTCMTTSPRRSRRSAARCPRAADPPGVADSHEAVPGGARTHDPSRCLDDGAGGLQVDGQGDFLRVQLDCGSASVRVGPAQRVGLGAWSARTASRVPGSSSPPSVALALCRHCVSARSV